MPSSHLILCRPLFLLPSIFPSITVFQMSQLFASGGQSIGVSASTSVLPMNNQDWSPLNGLVGSPCSPRDFKESSPTPQFKSINSLALSFLFFFFFLRPFFKINLFFIFFTLQYCIYSPTLTSVHDLWKTIAMTRWTFVDKVMSLLFHVGW